MKTEVWKPVLGYNSLYEVSSLGRVRSLPRRGTTGRILKPAKVRKGYLQVLLCKDGTEKWHKVHRLVAQAFIPNPNNYPCVNHRDENPENNCVDNLEWCDYSYNNTYGTRIKKILAKTTKPILQIDSCGNIIKEWSSNREVCRVLGYNTGSLSMCCNGKRKTAYGFFWKYKE